MNIRIPKPSFVFLLLVIVFQLTPSLYIFFNDAFSPRVVVLAPAAFFGANKVFLVAVLIFVSFYSLIFLAASSFNYQFQSRVESRYFVPFYRLFRKYVNALVFLSALFILIYCLNGGINKILMLGSDSASRDFRLYGFDNIDRAYTMMLQIARRIFLPLAILFYFFYYKIGVFKSILFLVLLISLQIFASFLTLARAPFFTLFLVIVFCHFIISSNKSRIFLLFLSGLCLVIMAGVLTKLQYNIVTFEIGSIIEMGFDFVANRMWVVPVVTPVNLSFGQFEFFDDKLYLSFSRISGLWGNKIIGTQDDLSVYVAPVGFIGDIWRNFGSVGIFLGTIFFTSYNLVIDFLFGICNPIIKIITCFLMLITSMYLIMGVVFSFGALFVLFLTFLVPFLGGGFSSVTPPRIDRACNQTVLGKRG